MMKVDMSRAAVTQRLKLMEELWVLSMALMDAGKKAKLHERRASGVQAKLKKTT